MVLFIKHTLGLGFLVKEEAFFLALFLLTLVLMNEGLYFWLQFMPTFWQVGTNLVRTLVRCFSSVDFWYGGIFLFLLFKARFFP